MYGTRAIQEQVQCGKTDYTLPEFLPHFLKNRNRCANHSATCLDAVPGTHFIRDSNETAYCDSLGTVPKCARHMDVM